MLGSIPATSKCFFSFRALGSRKEMELAVIKLHDLASPSRKKSSLSLSMQRMGIYFLKIAAFSNQVRQRHPLPPGEVRLPG